MSKFEDALSFAVKAHAGMTRKNETIPYVLHPMEVATIVATMTSDEDVLCAALLHDVVEDTPTTMEEVRDTFGERIATLVASETEQKRPELPPTETWYIRKEESLAELRNSEDRGVRILWLADKLANMRSLARLYELEGISMWGRFNQDDAQLQAWYYLSALYALFDLRDTMAWREYDFLARTLFEDVI